MNGCMRYTETKFFGEGVRGSILRYAGAGDAANGFANRDLVEEFMEFFSDETPPIKSPGRSSRPGEPGRRASIRRYEF